MPSFAPTLSPSSASHDDDDFPFHSTRQDILITASFSVFLYITVACVAAYFYNKFLKVVENMENPDDSLVGKYDHAKKIFFGLLTMSSLLEVPQYIGCVIDNGPQECEWGSPEEALFWFFHLVARSGYAYCIIIPCVLWSDMIYKKDGRLFFSNYPYDWIKRYFQFTLSIYFFNACFDILMSCIYYDPNERFAYKKAPTYAACAVVECIVIVLISVGCLVCGIRLQRYVHYAKLSTTVEIKFLFTLNLILSMIVISLLGRAVLILRFAPGMPESFRNPAPYWVYTLIARWLPDILCQSCLMYIMRLSGEEIMAKKSGSIQSHSGSLSGFFSGVRDSTKDRLLDEYEPDSAELRASFEENLLPVLKMAQKYSFETRPITNPIPADRSASIPISSSNNSQLSPSSNENSVQSRPDAFTAGPYGSYEEPPASFLPNFLKFNFNGSQHDPRRIPSEDSALDRETL